MTEPDDDVVEVADGDSERLILVARELNALRLELDDARARAAQAEADLVAREEEWRVAAEEDMNRALGESAARMESSLREAREQHSARLKEAEDARDVALGAMQQVTARAQRAETERDALVEELREVRRSLKAGRAEAEALRRERDTVAKQLADAERGILRDDVIEAAQDAAAQERAAERAAAAADRTDQAVSTRPVSPQRDASLWGDADDDTSEKTLVAGTSPRDRGGFVPLEPEDDVEPGETVRVIGRANPRHARTEVLPSVDDLPPAPPVLLYLGLAAAFVVVIVILVGVLL